MRKNLFVVVIATLVICSCGSSKKASTSTPSYVSNQGKSSGVTKVKEDIDECEEKSYDWSDGKIKAYASAINPDRDFARTAATTRARAELSASVKALVTNVTKSFRESVAKDTPTKSTYESSINQTADVIAEEVLANTHVSCSNRYQINDENGLSYEVSVCVTMESQMEEVCKKAVQKLSDEDVLGVKFDEEQFRKSYKEELEAYRKSKMNQ